MFIKFYRLIESLLYLHVVYWYYIAFIKIFCNDLYPARAIDTWCIQGDISLMFIFYTNSEYARKFKNSDLSNLNSFISGNVLNLSWVTANETTRKCKIFDLEIFNINY